MSSSRKVRVFCVCVAVVVMNVGVTSGTGTHLLPQVYRYPQVPALNTHDYINHRMQIERTVGGMQAMLRHLNLLVGVDPSPESNPPDQPLSAYLASVRRALDRIIVKLEMCRYYLPGVGVQPTSQNAGAPGSESAAAANTTDAGDNKETVVVIEPHVKASEVPPIAEDGALQQNSSDGSVAEKDSNEDKPQDGIDSRSVPITSEVAEVKAEAAQPKVGDSGDLSQADPIALKLKNNGTTEGDEIVVQNGDPATVLNDDSSSSKVVNVVGETANNEDIANKSTDAGGIAQRLTGNGISNVDLVTLWHQVGPYVTGNKMSGESQSQGDEGSDKVVGVSVVPGKDDEDVKMLGKTRVYAAKNVYPLDVYLMKYPHKSNVNLN